MLMNLPEKVRRDIYIGFIFNEFLKKFKRFFYISRENYYVNF